MSVSWAAVTNSQAGWLKTVERCSVTALEAECLESRCQQGYAPSKGSRGGSSLASLLAAGVAGTHWRSLAWICISPDVSIATCLSVFTCPSDDDASQWV